MWYGFSTLCIVYLEDVPRNWFEDSKWFDRGWTLQELIAPKAVSFFDQHWEPLGTKLELLESLSQKTGVPSDVLGNIADPSTCSVAQRMSWAAQRVTSRIEDRTYSLLGLFDSNMPMIYGEREKAFLRLQQHIVQKSKDESLFAWALNTSSDAPRAYFSVFASTPSAFRDCSNIVQTPGSAGFSENNGELSISLRIRQYSPGIFRVLLHCTRKANPDSKFFITISQTFGDETFVRVRDLENIGEGLTNILSGREVIIRFPVDPKTPPVITFFGFWLRTLQPPGYDESEITIISTSTAPEPDYIQQINQGQGDIGFVSLKPTNNSELFKWSKISRITFRFDNHFNPELWLENYTHSDRHQTPYEEALTRRQSGFQTQDNNEATTSDIPSDRNSEEEPSFFKARDVWYDWPHGRALVPVASTMGLREFIIPNLRLQISVQLQPCCSPAIAAPQSIDGRGRPFNSMLTWVVDITSTEARPESPISVMRTDWLNWVCNLIYCPCLLLCAQEEDCGCCFCRCCTFEEQSYSGWSALDPALTCYDCLYPCCKEKWLKNKEEIARLNYEWGAASHIPVLKPGGGTEYTKPTMRPMYRCTEHCCGM